MPFVKPDKNRISPDLIKPEFEEAPDSEDFDLLQTLKNGFVLENEFSAIAMNKARGGGVRDPNFDWAAAMDKLPLEYSASRNIGRMFDHAENQEHFDAIREQIDDRAAREKYNSQAGWKGVVGTLPADLFNFTNLLPFGAAVKGAKGAKSILQNGLKTAMYGASSMTASEVILHNEQETRTLGQSAANIAAGTAISGVLGAALHAKLRKTPGYEKFEKQFEKEMMYSEDADFIADVKANAEEVQPRSVGAAAVKKKSYEEMMDDNTLVRDKAFSKLKFQDPGFRLAYNESLNARLYLQDIAQFDPKFKKHLKGETQGVSVETEVLMDIDERALVDRHAGDMFAKYKKRVGKDPMRLSKADFNEEIFMALVRGGKSEIQEAAAASAQYRKLYTKYGDEGIESGLFKDKEAILSKRETYAPQKVNEAMVARHPAEYQQVLVDIVKDSYAKATKGNKARIYEDAVEFKDDSFFQDLAADMHRNQMGTQSADIVQGLAYTTKPRYAKKRVIDVDYDTPLGKRYLKFLDKDVEGLTRNYVNTVSRRSKLVKRFGEDFLDDDIKSRKSEVVQAISDDFKKLKAKAIDDPKKFAALAKQEEKTLNDVFGLRDRLLGTYGYSMNPNSWAYRAQKQIKQYNMGTMLGDVTASSVPDLGKLIAEAGFTKFTTRGMKPLIKALVSKDFRRYLAENFPEASRLSSGVEFVQGGRVAGISGVMDDFGKHTKFERLADNISQKAISATGIRHWNAALKQIASMIISENMIDAMKALKKGKASTKQVSNLARSGISLEDAASILKHIEKHGVKQGEITIPNIAKWEGPRAASLGELYASALRKDMDRVIVTPGIATTPLWMSKNGLTLFGQFQSFGFSSMQKTFVPMVQDFDANTVQGLTFMIGLGTLVAAYKRAASGRPMPDAATLIQEGVDRSGITGWLMDVNNRLEKISQGKVGISGILNTNSESKYYGHGSAAVLGPTSGQIDNLMSIASDVLSGRADQRTTHAVRKAMILQNMVGPRQAYDYIENTFNGALGIPKSK